MIERKAMEMLEKLFRLEPCSTRDLMRTYTVQKRAVHQPVLDFLCGAGKVREIEGGRLRLTEEARLEVANARAN